MNHEHSHTHGAADKEALALLRYMADHNAHHAEELEDLKTALPKKAAEYLNEAADLLNASTVKILEALKEAEG